MGKKLDALLGRGFKTSKFKAIVNLAISRLAVLKNQRQARCSIARSDVVQFLNSGSQERALLRVEQVIKEQNMLDVFVMLEGYCHLLIERVNLIEQEKVCPDELKEAVASLIFAATRCGAFPELQEIRSIFTTRFGKEFAGRAIELRNNCGVNPKIIHKMATRMPSLETKIKVLKEIASDNNINLQIEETIPDTKMEDQAQEDAIPPVMPYQGENKPIMPENIERTEVFPDSLKMKAKYKDVADAAQAAFESAAHAAAAARAAVELSRSESTDPDDPSSPNPRPRKVSITFDPMKFKLQISGMEDDHSHSEEGNARGEKMMEESKPYESETVAMRSLSASSSDSVDDNGKEMKLQSEEEGRTKTQEGNIVFDESDGEKDEGRIPWTGRYNLNADAKNINAGSSSSEPHYSTEKNFRLGSEVGSKLERVHVNAPAHFTAERGSQSTKPLDINRGPISVRTRRGHAR